MRCRLVMVVGLCLSLHLVPAWAGDSHWTDNGSAVQGRGPWEDGSNWSGGVPVPGESLVYVQSGDNPVVTQDGMGCKFLLVDNGKVDVASGSLTSGGTKLQGDSTFDHYGGLHHVTDMASVGLGQLWMVEGRYILRDSGQLIADGGVKVDGDSLFYWNGGTIDTPEVYVSGGTLAMGFDFDFSELCNGDLLANGGTVSFRYLLSSLGVSNGASGTHSNEELDLQRLVIGDQRGGGHYTLNSGDITIVDYMAISADSEFVQNGGTLAMTSPYGEGAKSVYVGGVSNTGAVGHGVYRLNDGRLDTDIIEIGRFAGSGLFSQSGGVHDPEFSVWLGRWGGMGTYHISGGSLTCPNIDLGDEGGHGVLNVTGGVVEADGVSIASALHGGNGEITVSGGTLQAGLLGSWGTGSIAQTGGHVVAYGVRLSDPVDGRDGTTVTVSAGLLEARDIDVDSRCGFRLDGGTVTAHQIRRQAGSTFSAEVAGSTLRVNALLGWDGPIATAGHLQIGHRTLFNDHVGELELTPGRAWTWATLISVTRPMRALPTRAGRFA